MPTDPQIGMLPAWMQPVLISACSIGWAGAAHMWWRWQVERKANADEDMRKLALNGLRESIVRDIEGKIATASAEANTTAAHNETRINSTDASLTQEVSERKAAVNEIGSEFDTKVAALEVRLSAFEQTLMGPEGKNGVRGNVRYLLDFSEAAKLALDRLSTRAKIKNPELSNLSRS
jgi:hypothetical protein